MFFFNLIESYSFVDWAVTGFGLSKLRSVAEKLCSDSFSNSHKTSAIDIAIDSLDTGLNCTRHLCECLCPLCRPTVLTSLYTCIHEPCP